MIDKTRLIMSVDEERKDNKNIIDDVPKVQCRPLRCLSTFVGHRT